MTSGGAEALKAAIRRSLPLIVGLIVLGIVAVNVAKQLQGARYESTARVLISTTPLSKIITGTEPGFVDPQRIQDTARTLAASPQVYKLAAAKAGPKLGGADKMKSATSVSSDATSDILSFTAASADPRRAVRTVNAVASAYVTFRGNLSGGSISNTVRQVRATLAGLFPGSSQRTDLERQLNKLSVLQTLNSSDAAVVERAGSATRTTPAPLKDSLLGFSIGLVVALLGVALREVIDTRVRSASDVEDLLRAPVLASVRPLPRRARIVTYGRHEGAYGDSYALLAAQLAQSTSDMDGVVLAVTSALAGEGKTSTSANLAVSLARRGARVLLADFDFRSPKLSQAFELPDGAPGALQVVAGSARLNGALWSVSLEGSHPHVSPNGKVGEGEAELGVDMEAESSPGSLHLLPAGGSVRSQVVTQSSQLVPLLRELRSRADFVVLDTPPALLTAEMEELSRSIDVVLFVVGHGRVTQRDLRTLGRQARTWPAEIAGAVLTGVPPESGGGYYYGGR